MVERVFKKYEGNPVISPNDMPGDIMHVLNPGAIKHNGQYIVMMDATVAAGPIVFWIARSSDGINFKIDCDPVNWPPCANDYHECCVYDPRITKFGDEYLIMYASHSKEYPINLGLVKTRDFISFERIEQERVDIAIRNGALFPEKIGGRYVRLDRPMNDGPHRPSSMEISYSDDLTSWGDSQPLIDPRPGAWDRYKLGPGAVPIKTDKGWLELYHAVANTCNGFIYRLGLLLLDLEDPSIVIARGEDAVLWPEHDYELSGRVPNVVFTCNAILENNKTVRIYYGAADTCIGMAEANLDDLIKACFAKNRYLNKFFTM